VAHGIDRKSPGMTLVKSDHTPYQAGARLRIPIISLLGDDPSENALISGRSFTPPSLSMNVCSSTSQTHAPGTKKRSRFVIR